jgi:type II secretory pathway component PulF
MPTPGPRDELTEFYRELALLVRSDLPLPESLEAIASGCAERGFRQALDAVASEVRRGTALSAALDDHARHFPEFHRALIRTGERAGALPEALHEVAEVAQRHRAMGLDFREIVAYPLATTWFAISLMLIMLRYYLPGFGEDIRALTETPLPPFSAGLFGLADWVQTHGALVLPVYLLAIAAVVWLFSEHRTARRALHRLLGLLPGTRDVVGALDLARVCGVCAALMRRGMPLPEVLAVTAGMAAEPRLAGRLEAVRRDCEAGRSLGDSAAAAGLPASLTLSLRHTRPEDLPAEIDALREHYAHLAEATARRVGILWQVGAVLGMGLAAGGVIIAMFTPMAELYRNMAVP